MHGTSTAASRSFASVLLLVTATRCLLFAAEPAPPGKSPREKSPREKSPRDKPPKEKALFKKKPLCRADITPLEGLPSRGLLLMSFDDGVYRVRTDREQFDVAEADIRSITFYPIKKRRPDSRRPPQPEPGRTSFLREYMRRQAENRRKLEGLRRAGKLEAHVSRLKARLASATTVEDATKKLLEVAMAGRANGTPPDRKTLDGLIRSIEDPVVRRRMVERQKFLMQILDRPRPGMGRPTQGRRFGPGRGTR